MKKYFSFILMFVSSLCSCNVIEEQEPNKVHTELYSYREFKEWYDVGSLEYGTSTLTSGNWSYGIFPKNNTLEILEGDMVSYEVEGEMLILETMPQQRSGNYELINIEIKPTKRVNFKVEKEKDTEELIIVNVDDDRKFADITTYPATSICYMTCNSITSSTANISGSAFYVDEEYLFTAAHMIIDTNNFSTYSIVREPYTNLCVSPGEQSTVAASQGDDFDLSTPLGQYGISESFLPLGYFYSSDLTTYDWAILKIGNTLISPSITSYGHGYLGIKYNNQSSYNVSIYGYPACYCYDEYDREYSERGLGIYKIRQTYSSGVIYNATDYYYTYMDFSSGNSGGPACILDSNSETSYAIGIVSNESVYGSGYRNYLSKISKNNFNLLIELVG